MKEKDCRHWLVSLTTSSLIMCSVPLWPDMLVSSRAIEVSDGSAKLWTPQFMCNLAFNRRSVIPVARPDYQPPSQQNCPYPVHRACFCTFAWLAIQFHFLHTNSLSSFPQCALPFRCFHIHYLLSLFVSVCRLMFVLGCLTS